MSIGSCTSCPATQNYMRAVKEAAAQRQQQHEAILQGPPQPSALPAAGASIAYGGASPGFRPDSSKALDIQA